MNESDEEIPDSDDGEREEGLARTEGIETYWEKIKTARSRTGTVEVKEDQIIVNIVGTCGKGDDDAAEELQFIQDSLEAQLVSSIVQPSSSLPAEDMIASGIPAGDVMPESGGSQTLSLVGNTSESGTRLRSVSPAADVLAPTESALPSLSSLLPAAVAVNQAPSPSLAQAASPVPHQSDDAHASARRIEKGKGRASPSSSSPASRPLAHRLTSPSSIFDADIHRAIASTSKLPLDDSLSGLSPSPTPVVAVPSPTRSASSQPSQPSPAAPSVDDQMQIPQGRSMRNRSAAQLNPYAMEQAKYARSLAKNGWQDAVVKFRRPPEDSAEKLLRKKEEAVLAPKDNLGGWLEYEAGQQIASTTTKDIMRATGEDEENGDDLLLREEMRVAALDRDYDENRRKKRVGAAMDNTSGSEDSNDDLRRGTRPHAGKKPLRIPKQAAQLHARRSGAGTVSNTIKQHHNSKSTSTSTKKRVRAVSGQIRSLSEPASSSPAQPDRELTSRKRRSTSEVIDISSSEGDSDPVPDQRRRARSAIQESDDDEQSDDSSSPAPTPAITKLVGKQKRKIINSMMPAVWMKKVAGPDLLLMENEKREGKGARARSGSESSGREFGSGDDDSSENEDEVDPIAGKGMGAVKESVRGPSRLLVKESESSEEDFLNDEESDESEDDVDIIGVWMNAKTGVAEESVALQRDAGRTGRGGGGGGGGGRVRKKKSKSTSKSKSGKTGTRKESKDMSSKRRKISDGAARKSKAVKSNSSHRGPLVRRNAKSRILDDNVLFGDDNDQSDGLEDEIDDLRDDGPAIEPISQSPASRPQRWSNYGKFTADYQITHLRSNVHFHESTLIGQHYLQSLLSPLDAPPLRFSAPFGIDLSSLLRPSHVHSLIPTICDAIFNWSVDTSASANQIVDATGESLQFLGHYVTEQLPKVDANTQLSFVSTIVSQFEGLDARFDAVDSNDDLARKTLNARRIPISWYMIDLNERVGQLDAIREMIGGGEERLQRLTRLMLRRLLQYGPERTGAVLKSYMGPSDVEEEKICDVSVEGWLCLIGYSLNETTSFDESSFWTTFDDEVERFSKLGGEGGLKAGERCSYIAMLVCAISQFSSDGISTSTPRLHAHWPTFLRTLDLIQPETLAKNEESMNRVDVARTDSYLNELFTRCLILVERWGWIIDPQDGLLPKLFDILNARRLADLSIVKGQGDFPPFLPYPQEENYDHWINTAFTTFLQLLSTSTATLRLTPNPENGRHLAKLLIRLSPIRSHPWSRRSTELIRNNSALVNHYSLFLVYLTLSPSSAAQRLDQARRFCDFNDIDAEARRACIRAAIRFALLYQQLDLDLAGPLAWLSSIVAQLRNEYAQVEKQQRLDKRQRKAAASSRNNTSTVPVAKRVVIDEGMKNMARLSLLLHKFLVSIQSVISRKKDGVEDSHYPDVTLLDPVWIDGIIDSPLALDPFVGPAIVNCIDTFLALRSAAMPRTQVAAVTGESQDEYGQMDFDLDDPILNAMLGVEAVDDDGTAAKDLVFAQMIKTRLSPCLFRLLSTIVFVDDLERCGSTIGDRSGYADKVVKCWTGCLAVMIENRLAEWSTYLRYGDQSWKRIPNLQARRDIGLLFSHQVLKHDITVFETYQQEFIEVWLQSLVAPKLTVQSAYTSILLNAHPPSPLLQDLPKVKKEMDGFKVISNSDFAENRLAILDVVITNTSKSLTSSTASIKIVLAAMRQNLTFTVEEAEKKMYIIFCQLVLKRLDVRGFSSRTFPELVALARLVGS